MSLDIKKLTESAIESSNSTEFRPDGAVEFTSHHVTMLDDLMALKIGHTNFLESLYEWGEEKGFLTEAQDRKLRELYDAY